MGNLHGANLGTQGLDIPPKLTYSQWSDVLYVISGLAKVNGFYIGDCLNYGEDHYGDKYYQVADPRSLGLNPEYLSSCQWVCRKFEKDRRRPKLSFQHHRECAGLEDWKLQDKLLKQAEENRWTSSELREAVREAKETGAVEKLGTSIYATFRFESQWDEADEEEFQDALKGLADEWDGAVRSRRKG